MHVHVLGLCMLSAGTAHLLGKLHELNSEVLQDGSALCLRHGEQRSSSFLHCSSVSGLRHLLIYLVLCLLAYQRAGRSGPPSASSFWIIFSFSSSMAGALFFCSSASSRTSSSWIACSCFLGRPLGILSFGRDPAECKTRLRELRVRHKLLGSVSTPVCILLCQSASGITLRTRCSASGDE